MSRMDGMDTLDRMFQIVRRWNTKEGSWMSPAQDFREQNSLSWRVGDQWKLCWVTLSYTDTLVRLDRMYQVLRRWYSTTNSWLQAHQIWSQWQSLFRAPGRSQTLQWKDLSSLDWMDRVDRMQCVLWWGHEDKSQRMYWCHWRFYRCHGMQQRKSQWDSRL